MTDTLWLLPKNGDGPLALVVDEQGRLILCEECPCQEESDCVQAVDDRVDALLAELDPTTQQPIWALQHTYTTDYACAEWEYDDEHDTWSLVSRASGHLLVALARGVTVQDTAEGGSALLTYAKTLINTSTLERRVVGCQCRVRNYECQHNMVTLSEYDIAGTLPVWEPGEGDSYSPSDSCRVDTCDLLKLKLTTAQLWHGGTLMGEGYYDWLLSPQHWEPASYRYQPFLMAVRWSTQTSTYAITYLNCECTYITTHTLAPEETCMEYGGICTLQNPCIEMMLLHNKAEYNGWTWHGEGLMASRVDANHACYDYNSVSRVLACADTGSSYACITCSCYLYTIGDSDYARYAYFEYPCCDCYDPRELLMTYPTEFGVTDISMGDDTVYTTDTITWIDTDTDPPTVYSETKTGSCLPHTTSYDACMCDYRNMYAIFDRACLGQGQGQYMLKFDTRGRITSQASVSNGTIVFEGHIQPFTSLQDNLIIWPHADNESGMRWTGTTVRWTAYNEYRGYYTVVSSQYEADALVADMNGSIQSYLGEIRFEASTGYYMSLPFIAPTYNYTVVNAESRYEDGEYRVYYPYRDWGPDDAVYNVNFITTNKGFLINGVSGYTDTMSVLGFVGSLPHWDYPPTEQQLLQDYYDKAEMCGDPDYGIDYCQTGAVKDVRFQDTIDKVPMYDMSYHITDVSEDMGGCAGSDWWESVTA